MRSAFLIRLKHWEYWNSTLVYAPVFPYYLWLSLKAGTPYFFNAANPSIRNGGFINESKKDVYDLLPAGSYPTTLLFANGTAPDEVKKAIASNGLSYPLIAKPDHGGKGLGVKKITGDAALHDYVSRVPAPFLVQPYVPYEQEIGLFYCRMPGAKEGFISGIVRKEMPTVTGDGRHTLRELILAQERLILQWQPLESLYHDQLEKVLPNGEVMELLPYGNHARGACFIDETKKVSPALTQVINDLCLQVKDFYFGRLDIRYNTWEELEQGKNFSVIELNGSGSEPTHMYDPAHTLADAWREIVKHWKIMYDISIANKKKGVKLLTFSEGRKEIKAARKIQSLLSAQQW